MDEKNLGDASSANAVRRGPGEGASTAMLVASLVIFGTLGLPIRFIDMPSSVVALARGLIGAVFLLLFALVRGAPCKIPRKATTWVVLLASGVCVSINWVLLFEAYRLTTIASAELAYEMAPVFVMAVAPVVLRERLTKLKAVCLFLAVFGMVLVSGVFEGGIKGVTPSGIAFGLGAAAFYASVMVLNQFLREVDPLTKTVVQLAVAGIVLVPYVAFTGGVASAHPSFSQLAMLVLVGIVHTGLAFALWFGSMGALSAQKVALLGYVDPIVALTISTVVLGETLTPLGALGGILVLGSVLASELLARRDV